MKRQMLFALVMMAGLMMTACGTKTVDETATQDTTQVVAEPAPSAPVAEPAEAPGPVDPNVAPTPTEPAVK